MGAMKRYAEQVSVDMGFNGGINDEVMAEAQRLDEVEATMKTGDFRYEVHIKVLFTGEELSVIELCMMSHYDGRVRAAAAHGGFLYGWKNRINFMDDSTLTCSFDQLDTCAKAIEQPSSVAEDDERVKIRARLQIELKNALKSINAETRRLHGE